MSSTSVHDPLVKRFDHRYSRPLLEFNDYRVIGSSGTLLKIKGFESWNRLIDINSLFSNSPIYDPVDRTGRICGPVRYAMERPWKTPTTEISLETALERRVQDLCGLGQPINLFWSGGIDSTSILVAFLKHAPDLSRCRVIYSPWSTYEHPDFFNLLKNTRGIELIDISGECYFSLDLDGIYVSGNTGDETHASLDQSFFEKYGYDFLSSPWRDFFYREIDDNGFMDFCEEFFSAAGRDITSVLEARWWFYISTKLTSILNSQDLNFLSAGPVEFDPCRLFGFFDCEHYENFIYYNTDRIILSDNYATWKQFLKDYCYSFDGFEDWRINKTKFGSTQLGIYNNKKMILNDTRSLMLLSDGTRVATNNLPLFSRREWNMISLRYRYLFRENDTI